MKNRTKEQKTSHILYTALTCLFLVALVKAFTAPPSALILSSEEQIAPSEIWTLTTKETPDGKIDSYTCLVPENIYNEPVLCLESYNVSIHVLLDNEPFYTYHSTFSNIGVSWKWVELPHDLVGHQLTIQLNYPKDWADPLIPEHIFLGDKNTIFLKILKFDLFAILTGSLTIIVGLIICFLTWLMREKLVRNVRKCLYYLGSFMFLSGVWLITDSNVLQFVTGRTTVVTLISFYCFMLIPYSLLRFIRKMMVYFSKKIMILAHLYLLNASVCLLLHLLQIASLQQTLLSTHILILISVVIILQEVIHEVKVHNNKEMKIILRGMIFMIVFLPVAFGLFYISPSLPYSVFYAIGLSIFELSLLQAVFSRLSYYLDRGEHAERYLELAYTDSMTKLGNRVAFTRQQESGDWKENGSYIVMDINNLKKVNDIYGHLSGDALIMDAGKCIQEAFGSIGKCYRIGGDEFVVISDTRSEEVIADALSRLEQAIAKVNENRTFPLEIPYGYAIRQSVSASVQSLFDEADARMYEKKMEMKASTPSPHG